MTQRSRIDKYHHHDATENPTVVFSRVVLRSIGKQAINEPNRRLNLLKADYMPIIMLNDSYDIDALGIFQNVQKKYRPKLSDGLSFRLQHLKDETEETPC
jgi:hypothetical protein